MCKERRAVPHRKLTTEEGELNHMAASPALLETVGKLCNTVARLNRPRIYQLTMQRQFFESSDPELKEGIKLNSELEGQLPHQVSCVLSVCRSLGASNQKAHRSHSGRMPRAVEA